jgi:integrase/recombinase XerD
MQPDFMSPNFDDNNEIICFHCGSHQYVKAGFTSKGKQRYRCCDCQHSFILDKESNLFREVNKIICPLCGNDKYWRRGFSVDGEQKYSCKTCNHHFYPNQKWKISKRDNEILCPDCGSNNYNKRGYTEEGKQQYGCKDCNRWFVLNPAWQPLKVSEKFDFYSDVWSAEQIGLKAPLHGSGSKLNFSFIQQEWLKTLAKKFLLYSAADKEFNSLCRFISTIKDFSIFLFKEQYLGGINDVTRSTIVNYLSYLNQQDISAVTKKHKISNLAVFFETGIINKWFEVEPHLIRAEDYPRRIKLLPRYIPEEVMLQVNQHLDVLPQPVMRMVLVLQECGFRLGELCQLQFDCLQQDSKKNYFIKYMMMKMKKEHTKPISQELANVIKEQQQYIQESAIKDFQYLFCGRKNDVTQFIPMAKVMKGYSFVGYLKKLVEECDIKDNSGKRWNFQSHQFRHTVGTRMINAGVPQYIVQKYLGHESPEMTMRYAHIHDETLRKEIEKYHESRVVNFQGETAELDETILSSNNDLEWFKKNVQARALEHGYCARPKVLGDCDIPGFDGCYNCPHWRTNKNFLPILKDTLERTRNVLKKAQDCGWELQVHKNTPIKNNLEKVIKTLEAGND